MGTFGADGRTFGGDDDLFGGLSHTWGGAISGSGSVVFQGGLWTDTIDVAPIVVSGFFVVRDHYLLTREDRALQTGVRPILPILVYAANVQSEADLASLPDNGMFFLASSFNYMDNQWAYQTGGVAGYIGQKVVTGTKTYYAFRAPQEGEVVCYVGSLTLYRFLDGHWGLYAGLATRAIRQNQALALSDAGGVIEYLTKVIGAIANQLAYDATYLLNAFDSESCPVGLLRYLGSQFGVRVTEQDSEAQGRTKIRLALPTARAKGTEQAVTYRLASLGYRGAVFELWAAQDTGELYNGEPFQSVCANDYYADPDAAAAAIVSVSGTKFTVAGDQTVAWAAVRFVQLRPPGPIGVGAFRIDSLTLVGSDTEVEVGVDVSGTSLPADLYPVLPSRLPIKHGALRDWPRDAIPWARGAPDSDSFKYFPTARLQVDLATSEWEPITTPPAGFATIAEFWAFIASELHGAALPVHADLQFLGALRRDADAVTMAESLTLVNA